MPEVGLQGSCVVPLIGERVAAGVPRNQLRNGCGGLLLTQQDRQLGEVRRDTPGLAIKDDLFFPFGAVTLV